MDFYQEQHSYTLACSASIDSDSDEDTSWVMLNRDGEVVKLPGEKIYYKVRSRIGLDLAAPKSLQNVSPFSVKSDSGIVYITNNRVIYLPARPTESFKSFSAPILDFEDTRVASSFFGPWSWNGLVKPTAGGNIPTDIPRLEIKLVFKEGGHDAFQSKFEVMKERLSYARTLQQETGQVIPTEDLPRYEATPSSSNTRVLAGSEPVGQENASVSGTTASEAIGRGVAGVSASTDSPPFLVSTGRGEEGAPQSSSNVALSAGSSNSGAYSQAPIQLNQATPDEPPPDYEEAQAQAIGIRFEEQIREAVDKQ